MKYVSPLITLSRYLCHSGWDLWMHLRNESSFSLVWSDLCFWNILARLRAFLFFFFFFAFIAPVQKAASLIYMCRKNYLKNWKDRAQKCNFGSSASKHLALMTWISPTCDPATPAQGLFKLCQRTSPSPLVPLQDAVFLSCYGCFITDLISRWAAQSDLGCAVLSSVGTDLLWETNCTSPALWREEVREHNFAAWFAKVIRSLWVLCYSAFWCCSFWKSWSTLGLCCNLCFW